MTDPAERLTLLMKGKGVAGSEQEDEHGQDRGRVFGPGTVELRPVTADVLMFNSPGAGKHELFCTESLLEESECKEE